MRNGCIKEVNMGWSIDLVRKDLDTIFKNLEKQYDITHPGGAGQVVLLRFEGDMPPHGVIRSIAGLFPEFVYVDFLPNQTFPVGSSIAEKH